MANSAIRPAAQQIRDLTVHLVGDVAQATYVPFRARVFLSADRAARLSGRYALGNIDTLTVAVGPVGQFTLRGMDGTADTLLAENDSTLFEEGDPGSWVFSRTGSREVRALIYRITGATDVVLPRVNPN